VRRTVVALLLGILAISTAVAPAAASKCWCRTDPVVLVGGQLADVFVSGPLDAPLLVTGPTQIVVTVPVGVDAYLLLGDLGFGRGTTVSFAEASDLEVSPQGIELRIATYVPALDDAMPVRVEFAPRLIGILWPDAADGTANQWIVFEVKL